MHSLALLLLLLVATLTPFYPQPSHAFSTNCGPSDCQVWYDGCNWCACTEGGGVIQTVMACVENKEPRCVKWPDEIAN